MKLDDVFFRAGVGIVLHRDGHIALFERASDPGQWQFPQGGMKHGETKEQSMWRELREETGLTEKNIDNVHQVPFMTSYDYPEPVQKQFRETREVPYIGQTHYWFFLELDAETAIDLSTALEEELLDVQWVQPGLVVERAIKWKRPPYQQVIDYFIHNILMNNLAPGDTYFRVGVGMVIYRPDGKVCVFQRVNPKGLVCPWQFPQGGTEAGESHQEALWRELREEVGLVQADVRHVTLRQECICYQYNLAEVHPSHPRNQVGRCNYWYFLQVDQQHEIDLSLALEEEFRRFEWVDIHEAALRAQENFHAEGYKKLAEYFEEHLR